MRHGHGHVRPSATTARMRRRVTAASAVTSVPCSTSRRHAIPQPQRPHQHAATRVTEPAGRYAGGRTHRPASSPRRRNNSDSIRSRCAGSTRRQAGRLPVRPHLPRAAFRATSVFLREALEKGELFDWGDAQGPQSQSAPAPPCAALASASGFFRGRPAGRPLVIRPDGRLQVHNRASAISAPSR